ncbi:MAG: CocE/NonD family hydrolase [Aquabacterium sp.]
MTQASSRPGSLVRSLMIGLLLTAAGIACPPKALAEDDATKLDATLNERIVDIPVDDTGDVQLEVTLMKPEGAGPFPLAVLNHGKEPGLPRDEKRYRSVYIARYFLSRGYAVALPMMRGFAESGGETWVRGCDLERIAIKQAQDIGRVIDYLGHVGIPGFPVDAQQVVVSGQSMGGWNTLAVGTLQRPDIKGLVNFAGGIHAPSCGAWQRSLVQATDHFAKRSATPTIWFYGDNDSKFAPPTWREMYDSYVSRGRSIELVAYGPFMDDAHNFLGKIEALPIWMPRLDAFLRNVGLPGKAVHAELLPAPYPLPSHFAALDDVNAIPLVDDKGRQAYQAFLRKSRPRVFALTTRGDTITTEGGYDPMARMQALCDQHKVRCQAYAVDDDVVWPRPLPTPPATPFAELADVGAVPFLGENGKKGYQRFLTLPKPRAFVIAPDGAWALSARDFDVLASALQSCRKGHQACQLYAVDDRVVWTGARQAANR